MKLKYLKWIHLLSFSVEIFKYRFSLRKLYFVNCEDYFISKHTSITKTIISIMLEKILNCKMGDIDTVFNR